ncbi:MAG: tetratricopeptide repeat protein [Enhydrobacter sp.]|nr:tetratricopeptide repeat protein [Enhydrobacter sp.]
MKDGQGLEVANADASAIEALDFLREEWLVFGKRFDRFMAAADREETCALLPVMAANLVLSMNSHQGRELGAKYMTQARAMPECGAREKAWIEATDAWIAGDGATSLAIHERLVAEWPRDLLAGKLGQLHAFNLGDAKALLRIGELLLAANQENHYVRGMHAFGLEECNRLDEAEAQARRAIEMQRKDPWAHHALAHCLEARGRLVEGVAFLQSVSDTWEDCNSFMYTHNWWHLALFMIDLDRLDDALALFDTHVWGVWKEFSEDQINAISLLARLELRGVDVGERWVDVACHLEQRLHDHFVPFLDLQYLYALARAGKRGAVTEMLASLEDRAERAKPFEREAWMDCAVPAAHGLAAHAHGDFPEATRLLGQAMPHLHSIGGSIAQRALFGAIHLDALIKSGWNDAAAKILQVDERERPGVPSIKRALADLYRKLGRAEQAVSAEYQAEQLARQYRIVRGVAA